jgi:hypothetical protein|tara:strand:+ start:559 stop:714 length:156 start_codon:yes stop_codon:yes gene_type:complete
MTEWNMTASQKKIKFFEDSHDELYERIELIEEKLETIIKLLEDININCARI